MSTWVIIEAEVTFIGKESGCYLGCSVVRNLFDPRDLPDLKLSIDSNSLELIHNDVIESKKNGNPYVRRDFDKLMERVGDLPSGSEGPISYSIDIGASQATVRYSGSLRGCDSKDYDRFIAYFKRIIEEYPHDSIASIKFLHDGWTIYNWNEDCSEQWEVFDLVKDEDKTKNLNEPKSIE